MQRVACMLLAVIAGCRTGMHYSPITSAELRARLDANIGGATPIEATTELSPGVAKVAQLQPRELAEKCSRAGACPLDDPATRWEIGERVRVPDVARIARTATGAFLVGAFAYGNYECFLGSGCSTGAKVAVGIVDGAIGLAVTALAVLVVEFALHPP